MLTQFILVLPIIYYVHTKNPIQTDPANKGRKAGKYRYIPREDKPIDWSSYTEAQYNEMADYLNLVREIIDEIRREIRHIDQRKVGRPPKSCFNLAKAIMVQHYFETSNRVTAGLLRVLKEKLNLTEDLTYRT